MTSRHIALKSPIRTRRPALVAVLLLAAATILSPATFAQQGLADLIPNLFDRDIFLFETEQFDHSTHFIDEGARLSEVGNAINQSLVTQLSTFPLASPSGGFTFTYDSTLGTFTRNSESFGSLFAERALTNGKGRWSIGFSYQSAQWDSIDNLDFDGDLAFQLTHEDTNRDTTTQDFFFEGDIIQATTLLSLESTTSVLFVNYGVTDNVEVSVAIPYLDVDLSATARLDIERLATGATSPIHSWDGSGRTQEVRSDSASSSGIGDVVLRSKWKFTGGPRGGWAAAIDLRLPTGDERDLLGTGATQAKLFIIGSKEYGTFSPHVNLGYTFSSGGNDFVESFPDELNYTLGFDWAATPRFTLAADLLGRTLFDAVRLVSSDDDFLFCTQPGQGPFCTAGATTTVQRPVVDAETGDLNLLLGSLGVRFNPVGNLLISLNGLYSLSDDGLQDNDIIPVVALEYTF